MDFARRQNIIVIHDMAYSDIAFDDTRVPSLLQVKGAKEIGVEFYTMSKSYNMAGWRVGFCLGNPEVIKALSIIKNYYDYGVFTPIQVAAIAALDGPQDCVQHGRYVSEPQGYAGRRSQSHWVARQQAQSVDVCLGAYSRKISVSRFYEFFAQTHGRGRTRGFSRYWFWRYGRGLCTHFVSRK